MILWGITVIAVLIAITPIILLIVSELYYLCLKGKRMIYLWIFLLVLLPLSYVVYKFIKFDMDGLKDPLPISFNKMKEFAESMVEERPLQPLTVKEYSEIITYINSYKKFSAVRVHQKQYPGKEPVIVTNFSIDNRFSLYLTISVQDTRKIVFNIHESHRLEGPYISGAYPDDKERLMNFIIERT